jgi:hypothetical protein
MSSSKTEIIIFEFLRLFFKNNKTQFSKAEVESFTKLVSVGVLNEIGEKNEYLELNNDSNIFNEVLLGVAEQELKKELPKDISGAFKFIDEFKEQIKNKNGFERIINAYSSTIRGLKGFVLQKLNNKNKIDITDYLFSLQDINKRENHLFTFEESFFRFLPFSNYSSSKIIDVCTKLWTNEDKRYSVSSFLRNLGSQNTENANQLLNYSFKNHVQINFISHILIGLYNAGDENALEKAIGLKDNNLYECLFTLCRIKYRNKEDIDNALNVMEFLNYKDTEIAGEQLYLLRNIIENEETSKVSREKCFQYFVDFLNNGTPEILKSGFFNISHGLDGFEKEKYELLHLYLSKTSDFRVIENFFYSFKDPRYIFDIMMRLFKATPDFRFSTELFHSGIGHAWQTNQLETESSILDLFKQPFFGILGVKVLFCSYHGIYFIDLLKLEKEEFQITAIKNICKYPHSFDKLIPVLLPLRNSKFKKVIYTLQNELAIKVFNSYHDTIYELIENSVGKSKKEKSFLKPIKKALDDYHQMKELKKSIKDLDPLENERDLMELYYRLEKEENLKLMSKTKKGSFMDMIKTVIIVRGNSMKHDDNVPTPMAKIETSMLIDGSSYKNPDLYERNLNN